MVLFFEFSASDMSSERMICVMFKISAAPRTWRARSKGEDSPSDGWCAENATNHDPKRLEMNGEVPSVDVVDLTRGRDEGRETSSSLLVTATTEMI